MITFKDKVFKKLFELPTTEPSMLSRLCQEADRRLAVMNGRGQAEIIPAPYDLTKKVSADRMEEFIATVKEFIRCDYGRPHGFYIELSNNYLTIYKKGY